MFLMDERAAPSGQSDNQDFFRPEGVVTSDGASAGTGQTSSVPQRAAPQQDPAPQRNEPVPADHTVLPADAITWTASEFIDHNKSFSWYMMLGLAAAVLAAVVWLFTKDLFSTAVVVVGALVLGVYAAHKPRQLIYKLDDRGLTIGERYYAFAEFRSFSLVPEGAFASIELVPLKRFAMYT